MYWGRESAAYVFENAFSPIDIKLTITASIGLLFDIGQLYDWLLLFEYKRQYIRQVCIYEQEQCQREEDPHGYAVRHGAEDLLAA